MLHPLTEGGGELDLGDVPDDPIPALLEASLGQGEACQLRLHLQEQEEVCWGEVL